MIVVDYLYRIKKSNDARIKPWDTSYVLAPVTEMHSLWQQWIQSRGAFEPFDDC